MLYYLLHLTIVTHSPSHTHTFSPPPPTDLSLGSAVQARLWDVPAEICCTATPSRPTTFLGLVIGPVELPWPHWPMELLPHAYTSLSTVSREQRWSAVRDIINTTEPRRSVVSRPDEAAAARVHPQHEWQVWAGTYRERGPGSGCPR